MEFFICYDRRGDASPLLLIASLTLLLVWIGGCGPGTDLLQRTIDLAGERSSESQYYRMETRIVVFGPDGTKLGTDELTLFLVGQTSSRGEEYTCRKFFVRKSGSAMVEVPDLANWRYIFNMANEKGDVLGIDRSRFQNLTGGDGKALAADMGYAVYNSFIDFHTFCNVFARRTSQGKGIQDLHKVGQRVVHNAAFSEPHIDVGSTIKEGSFFRNGEITLQFKGFSSVNGSDCALIGFDSGESSFRMILEPAPNAQMTTKGASHYQGEIYIDLSSKWVKKAIMSELVVSETIVPGTKEVKVSRTIDRSVVISAVNQEQFNAEIH